MFNFGKSAKKDPKEALDDASKVLNKGLMGGLTKAFMGKDFVDQANAGINMIWPIKSSTARLWEKSWPRTARLGKRRC